MQKAILGKKLGMTQIFDEQGNVVPVTVVQAGPCIITQVKTPETDGYAAVQLGFETIKLKHGKKAARGVKFGDKATNVTLPLQGHFAKSGVAAMRYLREFRLEGAAEMTTGTTITVETFAEGDKVDVVGTSKGKGWAGVIKRWNFGRLRESHGTGPVVRHGGSIGACSDPSRVFKGMKMSGHLGHERVTVQNLTIVKIDVENNLIAIKGAVPGPKGGLLMISDSVKA